MTVENQNSSDEDCERRNQQNESAHAFPSFGRFHFRLRTFVLLLIGLALLAWFVPLLITQSNNDDPRLDATFLQIGFAFAAFGFTYDYCHRFSRCPKCGKYALSKEGNYFINHIKLLFSLAGEQNHWEICRNCGHAKHVEVSVS